MEIFPVRNMVEHFDRLKKLYTMRTFSVRSEIRVPSPLITDISEPSELFSGGENIYFMWSNAPVSEGELARNAAKAFYEACFLQHSRNIDGCLQEIKYYDYNRPGLVIPAAHFTNLVWKSVARMGIAVRIQSYT